VPQVWQQAAQADTAYAFRIHHDEGGAAPIYATAMVEWLRSTPSGPQVLREYHLHRDGCGWSGSDVAPGTAEAVRVSLYHWKQLADVVQRPWQFSMQQQSAAPKAQRVTFAAAFQAVGAAGESMDARCQICVDTIRRAGELKVDLLCLSENFLDRDVHLPLEERAIGLDHRYIGAMREAARNARLHLVFSFHEQGGDGRIYNTAPLIGPDGQIIGCYRKNFLAMGELLWGMTPGKGFPVFQTSLGRIGILVCYDMWYPETAIALAQNGAEIICHPLAGDGFAQHCDVCWRARAVDHQVFLLSSPTKECVTAASASIIDPEGQVLATTREGNELAMATVSLPAGRRLPWLTNGPQETTVGNVLRETRPLLRRYSGMDGE
jgi:predicted amidohydrolase